MTENIKAFMEKASKDKVIAEKINAINKEKKGDENKKALIDLAKTVGIELAMADFDDTSKAMSESELDQVAGGYTVCYFIGFGNRPEAGSGTKGEKVGAVACSFIGVGFGALNS